MISKEGGEVWERLILYLDCPFLALSATVGNPTEFEHWLKTVSEAKSNARAKSKDSDGQGEFHLIKYDQRWNDLQTGWVQMNSKSGLTIVPINPIGTLDVDAVLTHGFPDIKLLPEQCLDVIQRLEASLSGFKMKDERMDKFKKRVAELVPNTYFGKSENLRITLNEVSWDCYLVVGT
jgi:ATP-dependent RNA helicase DDX60